MKTVTNFILDKNDVKALRRAALVLDGLNTKYFNNALKTYSAGDIDNIANIAEGLDPVNTDTGNILSFDWEWFKRAITVE